MGLILFTALACGGDDPPPPAPPNPAAACSADDECDGGRCDPRRGCVACLFDHDCPAGNRCDDAGCREIVACESSEDCEGSLTPVCDESTGECVACRADADCTGTAHCVKNRCVEYSACTATTDCAEGVCDVERSECVECVSGADCPAGGVCVEAHCRTPCQAEKDCSGAEPLCGPQGLCVECATHTHCPDVYHCDSGSCRLDVCEAPEARCDAKNGGIAVCAASGAGFNTVGCGPSQSCTEESGEPECVDWTCEPESEKCDENARYLELCSADGLSVASRTDCSAEEASCLDGACVPHACKPNAVTCQDGKLYRCSEDGSEDVLTQTCLEDEFCHAGARRCVRIICEADAPACDGNAVRACNETGTGYVGAGVPCDEDEEACFGGTCLPRVCLAPFECVAGDSFQCTDNGTRLSLSERCDASSQAPRYCSAETGRCELIGCEPSQPLCSGHFATVCADDGSAPVAGGVDCTLLDQACFGGSCQPVLCTEEFVCQEGDLYRCEDNGTALNLQGECGRPALCDAEAGHCLTEVCEPGDPVCNGSIATTCDETGTDYEPGGTDCAEADQGCFEGTCLPLVCTPDAHFCAEGDVQLCDETGTHSSLADDCETGEHCAAGEPTCVPNACSPGSAVCAGNLATTCRSDGSGPEPGGTDCALGGQACHLGECRPLVCPPTERFCENGHVRLCDTTGTNSGPYDTCLPEEHCDATDEAHCRADRCTANAPACAGETVATCNADGSGYGSTGANCSTASQVCDLTVGCTETAVDTFGGTALSSENPMSTLYLVALEVLTSRTIVELESYFAVPVATQITWLVYTSDTSTGTYSKQFEATTTAPAGTAAYHSSGPISVAVEAGEYYALGMLVRGAHTEFQGPGGAPGSFATVVSAFRTDVGAVPGEVLVEASSGGSAPITVATE